MFDRVLNMYLDYLSCFTVVLRVIHRNCHICQIDKNLADMPYKLEFFHYSEVIHGSKTFKFNERLAKVKEK